MLGIPFSGKYIISQGFGENMNNFYKLAGMKGHGGIDWAMPNGTPILSACDGEVIFTTDPVSSIKTGWGISILSDEIFQYMGKDCHLSCLYAHLTENSLKVKRGDKVKKGDVIALSNNTGQTTGPHLHFGTAPLDVKTRLELVKDNGYGGYVNPLPYLPMGNIGILALQKFLNKYDAGLVEDGIFGKLSRAALEKFVQGEFI